MHRDLKPDNILIDPKENIKIVDFGLAAYLHEIDMIFAKCGTPGYIAPEVFKYDTSKPSTKYNEKCDMFSAGCILYF
jgi:calcium-dependent protein kinase